MQLQWRVCRYWSSHRNPRSGLAHSSARTCAHWRSMGVMRSHGSRSASTCRAARRSGAATRSTSVLPSGSVRELRTVMAAQRRGRWEMGVAVAVRRRRPAGEEEERFTGSNPCSWVSRQREGPRRGRRRYELLRGR
jgi:hypothetical protein